jgi:hypothetical protein
MPWARASSLDRHLECAGASWFARADRGAWQPGYLVLDTNVPDLPPPVDDSHLAEWGTNMHAAKEGAPDAADPWLSWMEPHRERMWPAHLGVHELPMALCCRTGVVELGEHTWSRDEKDRWKRSRGPSFVTGEVDWWGALPGGEPWVDDLKTGWYAPSVTSPQLLLYALVAARHTRAQTVRISITHWRRGWEDPERKWQQVGPATLEAFEDELRAAYRRASAGPAARPGPWCRYCPSAPVCPSVLGDDNKETK